MNDERDKCGNSQRDERDKRDERSERDERAEGDEGDGQRRTNEHVNERRDGRNERDERTNERTKRTNEAVLVERESFCYRYLWLLFNNPTIDIIDT